MGRKNNECPQPKNTFYHVHSHAWFFFSLKKKKTRLISLDMNNIRSSKFLTVLITSMRMASLPLTRFNWHTSGIRSFPDSGRTPKLSENTGARRLTNVETHLSWRRRCSQLFLSHKNPDGKKAEEHWRRSARSRSDAERRKTVATANPHMDSFFNIFLRTRRLFTLGLVLAASSASLCSEMWNKCERLSSGSLCCVLLRCSL